MKKTTLLIAVTALIMAACGSKQAPKEAAPNQAISTHENLPGDSTRYGLACDGCTDSVLVFLPYSGGDPDTFNIIQAQKERRIFGRPHIGDELAVIASSESPHLAQTVINLSTLHGQWAYMVSPTLRQSVGQPARPLPDSILQKIMIPREYSIRLKRDNTAQIRGARRQQTTTDDMSPVEYPAVKHYTEWHIFNGQLVLTTDTIAGGGDEAEPENDTVTIQLLMRDSLVLRFKDHDQPYYRKK
mgnify:CR=1 FL=1